MKLRKRFMNTVCIAFLILTLTGCSESTSLTYDVRTGDTVEVTLDTSEGFQLEDADDIAWEDYEGWGDRDSFYVMKDDAMILWGIFFDSEEYETYQDIYESHGEIIEENSADGITWIFYGVDGVIETGSVRCFMVWLDGSDTGIWMGVGNSIDSDTAKTSFDSLTFSIH